MFRQRMCFTEFALWFFFSLEERNEDQDIQEDALVESGQAGECEVSSFPVGGD